MRLVLVDNDDDALDLVALDLGLEGHEIAGLGRDGAEALELCRTLRPDVLVVDYRMPPGIDGLEVARRVVADALAGRVVVHSNYQAPQMVAEAGRLGITWLAKGDLTALRSAINGHGHPRRAAP